MATTKCITQLIVSLFCSKMILRKYLQNQVTAPAGFWVSFAVGLLVSLLLGWTVGIPESYQEEETLFENWTHTNSNTTSVKKLKFILLKQDTFAVLISII